MFTAYSNEQLWRKDLSIEGSKSTYEGWIDQKLHQQFMQTISPEKEKEIKNLLLGQINWKDDESLENFYTLTWKLFRDWFVTEIQKDRSHVLNDFWIDDGTVSKKTIEIPLGKEEIKVKVKVKEESSWDNSKWFWGF